MSSKKANTFLICQVLKKMYVGGCKYSLFGTTRLENNGKLLQPIFFYWKMGLRGIVEIVSHHRGWCKPACEHLFQKWGQKQIFVPWSVKKMMILEKVGNNKQKVTVPLSRKSDLWIETSSYQLSGQSPIWGKGTEEGGMWSDTKICTKKQILKTIVKRILSINLRFLYNGSTGEWIIS